MGFRFNKRIKIMPGVHVNLGLGGASLSVGGRGASVNVGRKGVYGNVGIPGSGLSYRTRLDGGQTIQGNGPGLPDEVLLEIRDGRIEFTDDQGRDLPDDLRSEAVRLYRAQAEQMLENHVEAASRNISALTEVHLDTPAPGSTPAEGEPYPVPKPIRLDHADQDAFMQALMKWRAAKANHEANGGGFDPSALEIALSALAWPRETDISYQHSPDGHLVVLDVDLPELEDMPDHELSTNRKSLTIRTVQLSSKRIADIYSSHVASVVFRLAGTVFSRSPAKEVRISGYTQRASGTGRVEDEYVVAVVIDRDRWCSIDFSALTAVDPENALRRFGARLERTGRGALRAIEPCPGI